MSTQLFAQWILPSDSRLPQVAQGLDGARMMWGRAEAGDSDHVVWENDGRSRDDIVQRCNHYKLTDSWVIGIHLNGREHSPRAGKDYHGLLTGTPPDLDEDSIGRRTREFVNWRRQYPGTPHFSLGNESGHIISRGSEDNDAGRTRAFIRYRSCLLRMRAEVRRVYGRAPIIAGCTTASPRNTPQHQSRLGLAWWLAHHLDPSLGIIIDAQGPDLGRLIDRYRHVAIMENRDAFRDWKSFPRELRFLAGFCHFPPRGWSGRGNQEDRGYDLSIEDDAGFSQHKFDLMRAASRGMGRWKSRQEPPFENGGDPPPPPPPPPVDEREERLEELVRRATDARRDALWCEREAEDLELPDAQGLFKTGRRVITAGRDLVIEEIE